MISFRSVLLVSVLLFSLLLIGKFSNSTARPVTRVTAKNKTVLVFEKKPCFGFCPVYKAAFSTNGTVNVTYQQPGKEPATTSFHIPAAEISDFYDRGKALGFFKMKARYESKRTDFPVREITMFRNNKAKKISYTEGASPEFDKFLADLASLVESKLNVDFGPTGKE